MDHVTTKAPSRGCLSRRNFLLWGGSAVTVVGLGSVGQVLSGCGRDETGTGAQPDGPKAVIATYPRKRIATLSDLAEGKPLDFRYPSDDPALSSAFLVKLGVPAGAGVGPGSDIVAFSSLCSHMGGMLTGQYKHDHHAVGPCPFHLTTFDLRKHGMVVAGHATESLPQIVLEVADGAVYATGVLGVLYGTFDSKRA